MYWVKRLSIALSVAFLGSCVDVPNVATFASSVTVVTAATEQMVVSDRVACASMNATLGEFENLPKIAALGKQDVADCMKLGQVLDAIEGVNTVLDHYGNALAAISQDSVVNFDTDVSTLQATLKSLPIKSPPTPDQISAIGGLAGWLASLATQHKRDRAIENALVGPNKEMQVHFANVMELLKALSNEYADELQANANVNRDVLLLVSHEYGELEPLATAEVRNRLAAATTVSDAQTAAIEQYQKGLDAMGKAFTAAAKKPTAKELLNEVRDFAQQARSVYQSLTKAFPNR